jgi:ABC transport system ATP-binding/permease protein
MSASTSFYSVRNCWTELLPETGAAARDRNSLQAPGQPCRVPTFTLFIPSLSRFADSSRSCGIDAQPRRGFTSSGSLADFRTLTRSIDVVAGRNGVAVPLKSEFENSPTLRGLDGALAGRELRVEGPRSVIGRDAAACDIVLEHALVSRRHACIDITQTGIATITDLGSKTGTFVNGEPIRARVLRDGDRVGFGPEGLLAFTFVATTTPAVQPVTAHPAQPWVTDAAFTTGEDVGSVPRTTSTLRLGRAPDNDIVLDAPGVSRHHALLDYSRGDQPVLSDVGSTNGTFFNGEIVRAPRVVAPNDMLFLGGYVIQVAGRDVRALDLRASRLIAHDVRKDIDGGALLEDISFAIFPREFVGLIGPSGSGKTTLLNALNGFAPATKGTVFVNDLDLYRNFHSLRRSIGYVPQRDVLHQGLSVERTLRYAARLRLPEDTADTEVDRVVQDKINRVGLLDQRRQPFEQLSGGQQKRLSLAIELITEPTFLFLDEPTSPLDPETAEKLMTLFRSLADGGRIVVMVTHRFEKFDEMHQVAILTQGGRLAFFGPPRAALQYFKCGEPADIYRQLSAGEPDALREKFIKSPECVRYVHARIEQSQAGGSLYISGAQSPPAPDRFSIHQWIVLTERYLETKLKDRRNTLLLLLQAPVIALILAIITAGTVNDVRTLFIAGVMAIWFGANNAIREIVADTDVYRRERLVNLKIPSYTLSRFAVLSGFALVQCILFLVILTSLGRLRADDWAMLLTALYLTSLAGISIALFVSALVTSTEKAMSMLPLILIPQLLLSGFLKPLDNVYVDVQTGRPVTAAAYERFVSQAGALSSRGSTAVAGLEPLHPIRKSAGLGPLAYASGPIVARWTVDALAHAVSLDDPDARHRLPTQLTVRAYDRVIDGRHESNVRAGYEDQVAIDLFVLGIFTVTFVALTMMALRWKDRL